MFNRKYFLSLALFHEDMHDEAFGYTRQTLAYQKPQFDDSEGSLANCDVTTDEYLGDAQIVGGRFLFGSLPDRPFVFDNEMDPHEVEVKPFAISRTVVANCEFAAFVDDGGYAGKEFLECRRMALAAKRERDTSGLLAARRQSVAVSRI
jgi:iron(II)-dependent oxidoreductase